MFQLFTQQEHHKDEYAEDGKEFLLSGPDFLNSPVFVAAAFLFNPYTIFNCVGLSTIVFHNFFLALFLCFMLYGSVVLSTLFLAVCTMMSLYPVILVLPLFLHFLEIYKSKTRGFCVVTLFAATIVALKVVSSALTNGDDYMRGVYGFYFDRPRFATKHWIILVLFHRNVRPFPRSLHLFVPNQRHNSLFSSSFYQVS
jgi:phosphatidylinositol glycan class U